MDKERRILSIEILEDGFLDIRWSGEDHQLPTILGALHMAKKRITQKIDNMYVGGGIGAMPEQTKKIPKIEAFKKYAEVGKRIQERLHAIQNADDVAVFDVPTHLLDKI